MRAGSSLSPALRRNLARGGAVTRAGAHPRTQLGGISVAPVSSAQNDGGAVEARLREIAMMALRALLWA
jgi:hypothetical protein